MLVGMAALAVGVVVAHGVALARRGVRRAWPLPLVAAVAGVLAGPDGDAPLVAVALAAAVAAAVWLLRRTRTGLATAALAVDPRSVALLGRDPRRLAAAHVVAGTFVGAAGGVVGAPAAGMVPTLAASAAATAVLLVRRPRRRRADVRVAGTEPAPLMIDHVVVRDGGTVVLDGVTVLVEPGEVVGLVGPTGAGKSTLVGVVAGTVVPDEGAVRAGGPVHVLDQPSAGLTDDEAARLRERIRGVADGGGTVLLVEHDMDFALLTCDRIVALDRGRAIASGSPEDVRVHPAVVAAFLGRSVEEVVA